MTNSVVPIAKPPVASASTASPKWEARTGVPVVSGAAEVVDMVIASCNPRTAIAYSTRAALGAAQRGCEAEDGIVVP